LQCHPQSHSGTDLDHSHAGFVVALWREDRQDLGFAVFSDRLNWMDPCQGS